MVEPPEPSPDPQVPTSGPEYSSDYSSNGPVKQNSAGSRKKQERIGECKDSTKIVDKILEERMMNISANLTECELLKISKQLDGRERIDDMKKLIRKLEIMIEKGKGNVCLRAMVRSKKNELNRLRTRTPTSTPPESEDEDENGFNDYSVEHTCSGNIFYSSSLEQEISLSAKSAVKLENVNKGTQVNLETKPLVNKSDNNNVSEFGIIDAHQPVHFDLCCMQNSDFLSRNWYGGGKSKSNDSDVDYNPNDEKKT